MRLLCRIAVVSLFAAGAVVFAQSADVNKVLADARAAIGGDKLAAVSSLVATGKLVRFTSGAATDPSDYEMALQLPDKFFKKEVVGVMNENVITHTSGFNGDGLIDATDVPQGMFAGGATTGRVIVRNTGDGMAGFGAQPTSPEAEAASRKMKVLQNKQDFARLTLGLFASSFAGYPLEFSAGTAAPGDNTSVIINVKGEGDFAAKLYLDRDSHLPTALAWMAKEPIMRRVTSDTGPVMTTSGSGGAGASSGSFATSSGGGQVTMQGFPAMSPEERAQKMKEMQDQQAAAEANRRVVEYRMTYGDYKVVNGVNMPTRLHRTIDGKPIDDLVLEKITINPKIDPKKFDISK